jgi:two-component sensor histidine kinase
VSRTSSTPPVWDANRLRIATDAAGIALWSWDVDTDEITLDEKAHCLWNIPSTSGPVTFEDLSSRIHPQDIDRVRAAFTATRHIMGAYEVDFRIMHGSAVRWVSARGRGVDQGIVGRIMFGVFLDVTERKKAEEAREMLASEMSHRVKNLFSIACGLSEIAARSATTPKEMSSDLNKRLTALGKAHELIRPMLNDPQKATPLAGLLAVLLGAYDERGVIGGRISVSMPDIMAGEGSITTLALIIHELATNAIKYGSLSRSTGTLDLSATVDDGDVTILWIEKGGPPLAVTRGKAGFGSMLVNQSIVSQLGGSIVFDWPTEGLIVTLRMNQARLAT